MNLDISSPWVMLAAAALALFGPKLGLGPLLAALGPLLKRLTPATPAPATPAVPPTDPVPLVPAPGPNPVPGPVLSRLLDLARLVLARRAGVQFNPDHDDDFDLTAWLEEKIAEEAAKPRE